MRLCQASALFRFGSLCALSKGPVLTLFSQWATTSSSHLVWDSTCRFQQTDPNELACLQMQDESLLDSLASEGSAWLHANSQAVGSRASDASALLQRQGQKPLAPLLWGVQHVIGTTHRICRQRGHLAVQLLQLCSHSKRIALCGRAACPLARYCPDGMRSQNMHICRQLPSLAGAGIASAAEGSHAVAG